MTISFEIPDPNCPDVIEIFFDKEGLEYLIKKLQKIKDSPAPVHDHLMTLEWGGNELSSETIGDGNSKVHKVTYGKPK